MKIRVNLRVSKTLIISFYNLFIFINELEENSPEQRIFKGKWEYEYIWILGR